MVGLMTPRPGSGRLRFIGVCQPRPKLGLGDIFKAICVDTQAHRHIFHYIGL